MAVTMGSSMSWNASPGSLNADIKVTLVARVGQLGLQRECLPYLRLIAGPRYSPGKGELRFSSQSHATATANKRQVRGCCLLLACLLPLPVRLTPPPPPRSSTIARTQVLERLVALIYASQALLKKHGPLVKAPHLPAYKSGRTDKFFL